MRDGGAYTVVQLLLLSCAKSHMLSASRRQPHLLHVSAVDRRQTCQGAKKDLTDTGDDFLAIGPALRIMQLNVEGLSAAKREVISCAVTRAYANRDPGLAIR